ncbi:hypothetical protein GCM10010116_51510 [Microbispora rosea subsp. aerata]|nr:hypothetical protein [Microbispora rosea]GGO25671.1 hypothetical protein GCM10010116_51510 [Microbispora rosea subsp. aerata]GIH56894.1 hypothetical protein Mro02_38080 [Microbispora rosea subsp. aerata]GLJ82820.1 hypothetical protein GCM10017588_15460 [Microbispora rosea subsp. aerata]
MALTEKPNVYLDEDVLKALHALAKPFVETTPNAVLRRLLVEGSLSETPVSDGTPETGIVPGIGGEAENEREGVLKHLIAKGLLRAGERLEWRRPRLGQVHFATVLAGGCLRLDTGEIFEKPSPACKAISGQETDGWAAWRRVSDGKSLKTLREHLLS